MRETSKAELKRAADGPLKPNSAGLTWGTVPTELGVLIAAFFTNKELGKVAQVNKRWRDIINNTSLFWEPQLQSLLAKKTYVAEGKNQPLPDELIKAALALAKDSETPLKYIVRNTTSNPSGHLQRPIIPVPGVRESLCDDKTPADLRKWKAGLTSGTLMGCAVFIWLLVLAAKSNSDDSHQQQETNADSMSSAALPAGFDWVVAIILLLCAGGVAGALVGCMVYCVFYVTQRQLAVRENYAAQLEAAETYGDRDTTVDTLIKMVVGRQLNKKPAQRTEKSPLLVNNADEATPSQDFASHPRLGNRG